METLADLVGRDRRADRPALVVPGVGRTMSYRDLCTTAWKAGNFLRHLGVGPDHRVVVTADSLPEPVLTFLGAAQLGATTTFLEDCECTDSSGHVAVDDADAQVRAVVVGHEREGEIDVRAGTRLAVYGGEPSASATAHWETQVWSENPAFPPTDIGGDAVALAAGGDEYTHADLLGAAGRVVEELEVGSDDEVAVSGSLSDPGVVGGVVGALRAGAVATLTGEPPGVVASEAVTLATSSVLQN